MGCASLPVAIEIKTLGINSALKVTSIQFSIYLGLESCQFSKKGHCLNNHFVSLHAIADTQLSNEALLDTFSIVDMSVFLSLKIETFLNRPPRLVFSTDRQHKEY